MAARLEAATKQYGVPLLISGALHSIFSDEVKVLCREIDKVTVKGSIQPMKFYTVDLDFENMEPKQDRLALMTLKDKKGLKEKEKKKLHQKLEKNLITTWEVYSKDKDFRELRRNYDANFHNKFN